MAKGEAKTGFMQGRFPMRVRWTALIAASLVAALTCAVFGASTPKAAEPGAETEQSAPGDNSAPGDAAQGPGDSDNATPAAGPGDDDADTAPAGKAEGASPGAA